jgi:hypothetical protein
MQQAWLQGSSVFHAAYYLPEKTIFTYHSDTDKERAVTVQRAAYGLVSGALLD